MKPSSSVMNKYRAQGDLADILRPINPVPSDHDDVQRAPTSPESHLSDVDWLFPIHHDDYGSNFGDPFFDMKDPLLHELVLMTPNGSSFFGGSILEESEILPVEEKGGGYGGDHLEAFPSEMAFNSTLYDTPIPLQSPQRNLSTSFRTVPLGSLENPMACSELINPNSSVRLMDSAAAMQISAVHNSGVKRRKGQAKKVVCIPATTAANGRSGSEVVPSDLWAWRKYGQKPIKGSPYPRGYYRCSSSKGCLARKQVERSSADPNTLVITYSSEHNHPWPTQRNALMGSTRTVQSAKKNTIGDNAAPKIPSSSSPNKDQLPRDKRQSNRVSVGEAIAGGSSSSARVKEEMELTTNTKTLAEAVMAGSMVSGKYDEHGDFPFQDLEAIEDVSNPVSFLLNKGDRKLSSGTADSDSLTNFFNWST